MNPPPSPAWANFTLMMECTPESECCYSVYSVVVVVSWIVKSPFCYSLVLSLPVFKAGTKTQAWKFLLGIVYRTHYSFTTFAQFLRSSFLPYKV